MNKIPELLVSLSGEKIDTKEKWEKFRRGEVKSLLSEYIYGFRDIERPKNLYFEVKEETVFKGMRKKEVICGFNDFSFPFTVYLPHGTSKPLATFLFIFTQNPEKNSKFDEKGNLVWVPENADEIRDGAHVIPVKDVTDRGFAIALMPTRNVYPDWQAHAEFKQGVFAAYKHLKPRTNNSWAGISAWSWGAERVMDYFETDNDIDEKSVAVLGFSRGGKAALWTAACDERFKLSVSDNSGCAGAAMHRGKQGEHIKDINISDWFCDNYHGFDDNEEMLPVDQHMLISLIAPRYVYVTSSQDDLWSDPEAEYRSCKLATPAFELYGVKGLVCEDEKPPFEKPSHDGHIAYHMKWGEHSLGTYDWEKAMDYFEKIINEN